MAIHRFVNIELPEAKRLADLYSIGIDLSACSRYCDQYLEEHAKLLSPEKSRPHYLESFSIVVFVKYGRCFKGGVRVQTEKELLQAIPKEFNDFHKLVVNIRDKYIAHSVNDFENHDVRVWLNPEERGKKVNNVNIGSDYLTGPEPQMFIDLKSLVTHLIGWVEAEKKKEESQLKAIVEERYSVDELYSIESKTMRKIDYDRVAKTRKNP